MIHDNSIEDLGEEIGALLHYTVNEPILIKRIEKYLSPKPASLARNETEMKLLNDKLETLARQLGAPPDSYIRVDEDQGLCTYDEYGAACLAEMVQYYYRCRYSIIRAHLLMVSKGFFKEHPNIWGEPMDDSELGVLYESLDKRFWQETEISLIRLASFWDRVGQLLDFMFFNIRQYDRDAFSSVMDRMEGNLVPVFPELRLSDSYNRLRTYQTSEREHGLKWLLRRRNLLVHSLYLRPFPESDVEEPILAFVYNHLEKRIRNKLSPGTEMEEVNHLHDHLRIIAELFSDIIGVSYLALELKLHVVVHRPKQ